jgi:hypothetical protein
LKLKIFYSWQSDLPSKTNRGAISSAVEKAIAEIHKDQIDLELNLDRDTKDVAGTPDIIHTIFNKINTCQIFIGDISIVNNNDHGLRKTPNPNVLIELGYAAHCISWQNIILLFNKTYGDVTDLPFDLRIRRPLIYELSESASDKKNLQQMMKRHIEAVIAAMKSTSTVIYGRGTVLGTPSSHHAVKIIKSLQHSVQLRPGQKELRLKVDEEFLSLTPYVMFATPERLGAATGGISNIDGAFELVLAGIKLNSDDNLTYNLYRSSNQLRGTVNFQIRFYDLDEG